MAVEDGAGAADIRTTMDVAGVDGAWTTRGKEEAGTRTTRDEAEAGEEDMGEAGDGMEAAAGINASRLNNKGNIRVRKRSGRPTTTLPLLALAIQYRSRFATE